MNLSTYWKSLDAPAREQYASRCGTTLSYIKVHLIPVARKVPRKELLINMAKESDGNVSIPEVLAHFYGADAIQEEKAA